VTGRLYIAAKAPWPGFAKTRLGRVIGYTAAVELYRAFLRDLAVRLRDAPFPVGWYITPADAWPELAPLVAPVGVGRVLVQGDGTWTDRQRTLFHSAASRGDERTVLLASDSPQITSEVVRTAFVQLDRHDLVLGPVEDGGYYLLGMRGWHDVLQGIPMSTDRVVDDIVERATHLGLSVGLLATTFDVDEASDLVHLRQRVLARPDLPATRTALAALGLLNDDQLDTRPIVRTPGGGAR
jgi:rSAM/selenodomain-associated transferase 1